MIHGATVLIIWLAVPLSDLLGLSTDFSAGYCVAFTFIWIGQKIGILTLSEDGL